jgi:hypothetical protein
MLEKVRRVIGTAAMIGLGEQRSRYSGCFVNAKMEEGHYCTSKVEAVSYSETLVHI